MTELKSLSSEILLHIAQTLNVPMKGLVATIELLDEGGTVPFIARYRKEATGNLDEVQIRGIEEKLAYFRELQDRKATILASIEEQGKLTDELKARIEATLDKSELEDLYLPYKPKRRTKATIAREKGLEPLADYLWAQQPGRYAARRLRRHLRERRKRRGHRRRGAGRRAPHRRRNDQRGRRHPQSPAPDDVRGRRRRQPQDRRRRPDEQEKFKMYYDYREPVKSIPSHRMLAIRRGETESVLYFPIELEPRAPHRRI